MTHTLNRYDAVREVLRTHFSNGIRPTDGRLPIPDDLAKQMINDLDIPKDSSIGVFDSFVILCSHLKEQGFTNVTLIDTLGIKLTEQEEKYYNSVKSICSNSGINVDHFAGMKFDVVIGNPPYQKGKNSNFYVEFIKATVDLTNDGGVVTLITPNRFMLPHTPASQVILNNFQVVKYWIDVNKHFPTVGTNIGMFKVVRSKTGHTGLCDFELTNGDVVKLDPREITLPSRVPTVEGIERFNVIKQLKHFEFVKKQPTHDNYVYVCRQWKTKGGRPYFDAEVGHSLTGDKRDGRFIETDKPQEVCDYLRSTDYARELHQLFGDQMNIWPFLWSYIPTCL